MSQSGSGNSCCGRHCASSAPAASPPWNPAAVEVSLAMGPAVPGER
eukprot:CAMPEP_0179320850 /NCGR_PEP_ID=MMETSP0797-20121207/58287_1 /TAXON_ID=47934 /ORGANISM="Dinophysis acuminata, Strain DAEP01" /LENGTH=45 /DNA_ID= /DNA_START= /DNA_END= /DNA_ORIENTATION=